MPSEKSGGFLSIYIERKMQMWRAIRTKSRLDEFINEAMLTPIDVEILQTRLKGWSRVQQSQHFNMSIGAIDNHIRKIKESYENIYDCKL